MNTTVSTHSPSAGRAVPGAPTGTDQPADRYWHSAALACTALLAPALVNEHGKGAAEALTLCILIGYARHLWLQRGAGERWSEASRLLILLWLWLNVVVSPLALDAGDSFTRTLTWFRMPTLAFAIGGWVLRDRRSLAIVTLTWGATLLAGIADGLWQLWTGVSLTGNPLHGDRITGPMRRPNIGGFTARLGLPLLASLVLLLPEADRRARLALWLAGLLALAFVLLTGERSASIMLLLSLGVAFIRLAVAHPGARAAALIAVALMAVLASVVVLSSERIQARLADTVAQVTDPQESVYAQVVVSAAVMASERPVSGVGMHGYREACPPLLAAGRVRACQPHPHNLYAEWLAECGLPACLAFIAFVLLFSREVLTTARPGPRGPDLRPWLLAALVMVLFPLQVTQSFFDNRVGLTAWASLGLILAVARLASRRRGPA